MSNSAVTEAQKKSPSFWPGLLGALQHRIGFQVALPGSQNSVAESQYYVEACYRQMHDSF
jgi:hypothetical protein